MHLEKRNIFPILHLTIEMVYELNVPAGYFTHISHQLGTHAEITDELPSNIHLAYDRLVLNVQ